MNIRRSNTFLVFATRKLKRAVNEQPIGVFKSIQHFLRCKKRYFLLLFARISIKYCSKAFVSFLIMKGLAPHHFDVRWDVTLMRFQLFTDLPAHTLNHSAVQQSTRLFFKTIKIVVLQYATYECNIV